jgi:hypothetical protein
MAYRMPARSNYRAMLGVIALLGLLGGCSQLPSGNPTLLGVPVYHENGDGTYDPDSLNRAAASMNAGAAALRASRQPAPAPPPPYAGQLPARNPSVTCIRIGPNMVQCS